MGAQLSAPSASSQVRIDGIAALSASVPAHDAAGILRRAAGLGKITGVFSKKVSPKAPCCFTLASFLLCLVQGKP
jgi:hypothetical protein